VSNGKAFSILGEEPRLQFQACNLIGRSKTMMAQEAKKMDVALPLLCEQF